MALRLSRRAVLTGTAALFAGAVIPSTGYAADQQQQQIRAAAAGWTGRNGELLVLTADAETGADCALRILEADTDAAVEDTTPPTVAGVLGPPLPLPLPADFRPHSMAATGAVLWLTGAVEVAHDRSRPALVRMENGAAEYADLPVPEAIRSGIATAAAPLGGGGLAIAVEGGSDEHFAGISRSHLLTSFDGGGTWSEQVIAEDLGEGYGTFLAENEGGLFAVVGDGGGAQTVFTSATAESAASRLTLARAASIADAGRPMAAVAGEGHVSVFSDKDGVVVETRFTAGGSVIESTEESAPECGCGQVHAVPGERGVWLETDGRTVHIRGNW